MKHQVLRNVGRRMFEMVCLSILWCTFCVSAYCTDLNQIEQQLAAPTTVVTVREKVTLIQEMCKDEKTSTSPERLVQILLENLKEGGNSGEVIAHYQLMDWTIHECNIPDEIVLDVIALSLDNEKEIRSNLVTSLLGMAVRRIGKEKSLEILVSKLAEVKSNLNSGSALLRFVLRRYGDAGLRELSRKLPEHFAFSKDDFSAAESISECIILHEQFLVFNEAQDFTECSAIIQAWTRDSNWANRLYVLEITKKYPTLIGEETLEALTRDLNEIVRESALDSLGILSMAP